MMRYFYFCLLMIGMGLPLSAKNAAPSEPTPSYSSKNDAKPATVAVKSQAKEQSVRKSVVTLTPDTSRSAGTPLGSPILGNRLVAYPSPESDASMSYAHRSAPVRSDDSGRSVSGGRLARVTAYWAGEGDYYTGRSISATGVRLHDGHCAVDPSIIPYGSVVEIAGLGKYLAVDTGSAVISRTAARESGHNSAERNALVIDVFFEDARDGERFAAGAAKFASITWWTPSSADSQARARSLFAEEDWTKIQSKQL
jgi:3D (Asp-Asp-Asp) domain-containing protein